MDDRIVQGEAILGALQRGPLPLEARTWHEKNEAILQRLFTRRSEYESYRSCIFSGVIIARGQPRDDDETPWHEKRLQWLRSLRSRLDVYEAPAPAQAIVHTPPAESGPLKREVFLVHGHDEGTKQEVARALERLGLKPIILHEQPDAGRVILEKFEAHADVGYAVVLLTPDDECGDKRRARQNVILELGYFLGKLGRRRVSVIYEEGVEIPSDYQGVLYTPLDPGTAWRFKLAREMKAAGLDIDLNLAV